MTSQKEPGLTKYGNHRFSLATEAIEETGTNFRKLMWLASARLDQLNYHLLAIAKRIVELQPKKPGSVTLELTKCGVEGCFGCPHPKWRIWHAPQGFIMKERLQLLASGKDAKSNITYTSGMIRKRLKKTDEFEPVYPIMLALIGQVEHLLEDRKSIYRANLRAWHQRKSRWEDELAADPNRKKAVPVPESEAVPIVEIINKHDEPD